MVCKEMMLPCVLVLAAFNQASTPSFGASETDDPLRAPLPPQDPPTMLLHAGPALTAELKPAMHLGSAVADPGRGIYGARLSLMEMVEDAEAFDAIEGVRQLSWIEGYGTTHTYIILAKKDEEGNWIKYDADPDLTKAFANHWHWDRYDGEGEALWVGPFNYFDDTEFARPYTRTHPRYGAPRATYPNGMPATGYNGPANDPRNHRFFDATTSKNVLGKVNPQMWFDREVNALDPETGELAGPTDHLLKIGERYSGCFIIGKDQACPIWQDYDRASIRHVIDEGAQGLWVDNWSLFDALHHFPVERGFGEWSVAAFRNHLEEHFTGQELQSMGVLVPSDITRMDLAAFDVRQYLQDQVREMGGNPTDLKDPAWSAPAWREDPVWRAYLVYKRRSATEALNEYYRIIKEEAAAAGKEDFLVTGNDTPAFGLGMTRGSLDMISTEVNPGYNLVGGGAGMGLPPEGSYVPFYRLARPHAKSNFVNAWLYSAKGDAVQPNLCRVLYYQAMANNTFPSLNPNNSSTYFHPEAASEFFAYVNENEEELRGREPLANVGLYFSTSSQLMQLLPGSFLDFDDQPHVHAHLGWGTALSELHVPYRPILDWRLDEDSLDEVSVLVIPNAEVFDPAKTPVLQQWIDDGGKLLVTGGTGLRGGEEQNFARLETPALSHLAGAHFHDEAPGREFYRWRPLRDQSRQQFVELLRSAGATDADLMLRSSDSIPPTIGIVPHVAPDGGRILIDLYNTKINRETDEVTSVSELEFSFPIPEAFEGQELTLRWSSPHAVDAPELGQQSEGWLTIRVPSFDHYLMLILESSQPEGG